MTVEESVHVVFDETNLDLQDGNKNRAKEEENSSELLQKNSRLIQKFNRLNFSNNESNEEEAEQEAPTHEGVPPACVRNADLPREWRIPRDLSLDNIIDQIEQGVSTRCTFNNFCENMAFVSQIEPTSIDISLSEDKLIDVMHDELNQFTRNNVWVLVPRSPNMHVIGTKWVFRNKLDEQGIIVTSHIFHIIETLLHKKNYIINLNIIIHTFIMYFKLYFST